METNNFDSLLVEDNVSRFRGASWFKTVTTRKITLAGLGGIGSYVGFLLGRLQPDIINIYDMDIVERGNMSGQLYGTGQIGFTKATALASIIMQFADYRKVSAYGRFVESSSCQPIAICGFDNMEARKTFYYAWKRLFYSSSNALFIDGRLAMEDWQVFAFTGDNDAAQEKYETEWLFSDEEAEETICSQKQTSFTAAMIASYMVNVFVNHCANIDATAIPRPLPFKTEYNAAIMHFTKEFI